MKKPERKRMVRMPLNEECIRTAQERSAHHSSRWHAIAVYITKELVHNPPCQLKMPSLQNTGMQ
jgi:hypothetical protein